MTRPLHAVPDETEPVADAPPAEKVVAAVPEDPNVWKFRRTGETYASVINTMRERPGEWFRIVTWPDRHRTDRTLAGDIRRGKRGFTPAGSFEAISGFTTDHKAAIWSRYTPRENPPAAHDQLTLGDAL